ncbi:MAG: AI-2E family transporter [Chloroflexota bacterium]
MSTKRIIAIIAFIAITLILFQFRSVLPLIFSAIVIAYLFNPVANFFQHRMLGGKLRPLAVGLTFGLIIAIIVVTLLFVVPALIEQIQTFFVNLPDTIQDIQDWVTDRLDDEIDFAGTPLERFIEEPILIASLLGIESNEAGMNDLFGSLQSQVGEFDTVGTLRQLTTSVTGSAFVFVGGAFSTGLNIIFLLTMTFYLMVDGVNMVNAIVNAVPDGYHSDVRRLLRELGYVWNSYLRGQVTLSLIMGTAMYLLARILGIPSAIFLGIFAGLMEFIPNIGPATAMVPAAGIALFSTSSTIPSLSGIAFAIVVIICWTILQQTEAAILIPRIVGDSLNLHPFAVIVAVVAGVSVGGIFAVLVAAPVMASFRLVAQYVYGKLMDKEPFPVSRKTATQMMQERRPPLVRLGDFFARQVRNLMSSRAVTRR